MGPRQPEVPEGAPEQRLHVQYSTTCNGQTGRPARDIQGTGPQDAPINGNSPRPSKRRHVDSSGNRAMGSDEPEHGAEPVQMSIDAQVITQARLRLESGSGALMQVYCACSSLVGLWAGTCRQHFSGSICDNYGSQEDT